MVDEHMMARWAQETLAEWLPGNTDYDDVLNTPQYRIFRIDDRTYGVETPDRQELVGRFRVVVAVVALP